MLTASLISVSFQAQASETAEQQICFDQENAQILYSKLQTCKQDRELYRILGDKYSQENGSQDQLIANLTKRVTLTDEQLQQCRSVSAQYKTEWQNCGKELIETKKSQPSRATWFGIGAGTSLVVVLAIVLI